MEKLVIWGAAGHALVVADIIRLRHEYDLIGFVDNVNAVSPDATFSGLPLFGGEDLLAQLERRGGVKTQRGHVSSAAGQGRLI